MSNLRAVLVVEPVRSIVDVCDSIAEVTAEWERDASRALEALLAGDYHAALVAGGPDGGPGVEFIREARARGCPVPLLLVARDVAVADCRAALAAGASACVDVEAGFAGLGPAVEFAGSAADDREHLLGELASFFSHEGKNAMAGIGGAVQVIADRLDAGSAERAICEEIGARLRAFDASMEMTAFLIRPPSALAPTRVSVHESLAAGASEFLGQPVEVTGDDLEVLVDRDQFRWLAAALLLSLREALPGGAVAVDVRRDGAECVLEVSGVGAGGPPCDLTCVLEPFYITGERKPGLGLPVAKRIAEAHGGALALRWVGGGFGVVARLPLAPPTG